MFTLTNGNPIFYIGKINGIGYTNEYEKEQIIERLKEDNPTIKIKDERVEIELELKEKAEALAELKLTYSKSEFEKYLSGEKVCPELQMLELQKDKQALEDDLSMTQHSLLELQKQLLLGGLKNE